MKKTRERKTPATARPPAPSGVRPWHYLLGVCAFLYIGFQIYAPALRGPFLFDDNYLPMTAPGITGELSRWIGGVRPLLYLSYWVNFRWTGVDTMSYHVVNVLIHVANAVLLFFIARRLLRLAAPSETSPVLPLFVSLLFLAHPLQTESVAYIAGRSESLSTFFVLCALAVFLYRRAAAISWLESGVVLGLFLAALATKEHVVVLPVILLLTDYFFNPGFSFDGIRRNWRLYVPMVAGGVAGAVFLLRRTAGLSAGFGMKDLPWHDYLFTQFRSLFVYLRLFFFPTGLNADYEFPISRSITDHGAIFGLLGLMALAGAVLWLHKRYPLACYGLLFALIVLAPTSSILPIRDPIAERRMYLPVFGLLLATVDGLRRLRAGRAALAGSLGLVVCVAGALAYQRNHVWSGPLPLWLDTVRKSPRNSRAHFQLAFTYYLQGRCTEALAEYEMVAKLEKPDYRLLIDWGLAYDCLNQGDQALAKLTEAAKLERTAHVYSLIGMVHAKNGRATEAWQALDTSVQIDDQFDMTYVYRGHMFVAANDYRNAAQQYRKALEINPRNQYARDALTQAEGILGPASK